MPSCERVQHIDVGFSEIVRVSGGHDEVMADMTYGTIRWNWRRRPHYIR